MPGSPWQLYWNRDEDKEPYDEHNECKIDSYASVSGLLAGMVVGRFGLWVADITITQITQESVLEEYRGTIGGKLLV